MKIKISMEDVFSMIHTLEKQNNNEAQNVLAALNEMFAPLLKESEKYCLPPTYEVNIDEPEYDTMPKSDIDWEQRRYEIARDCTAAEVLAAQINISNNNVNRDDIASRAIKMADTLIEQLGKR